jgi:tRNA modification GTPase
MMKRADVVVYLFDVNTTTKEDIDKQVSEMEQAGVKYLLAGNKTDLGNKKDLGADVLYISAKEKGQIDALKQELYHRVVTGNINTEGTIITSARHLASLHEVAKSLHDIKAGMDNNIPGDLIALDIRRCLFYLGEITGEVTTEDKLDYIFSKFCIGK